MNIRTRQIEVDETTAEALEVGAAAQGVTVAAYVAELAELMRPREGELAELEQRWLDDRETVPHEQVEAWLDTWGTPAFKPWTGR